MTASAPKDINFEAALKELEAIVRKLESGGGDLEAMIADYTRGSELKEFCSKKLSEARLKVEAIIAKQDGSIDTAPFHES